MLDFNLRIYKSFLETLISHEYSFITFSAYLEKNGLSVHSNRIILRHDVEQKFENALQFARIQNQLGIVGTYFFRIIPNSFKTNIVKQIADLGHEIGYHYDDLTHCNGDYEKAITRFEKNLRTLRDIASVQTICMDGSPRSRFDNRYLWDHVIYEEGEMSGKNSPLTTHRTPFSYEDYGIIGEPYFDIDFDKTFYLTDTGRRWDGHLYNVRDKATKENPVTNPDFLNLHFRNTQEIITSIHSGDFPKQAMLNFHPQRWNDRFIPWLKEEIWQNIKNQGKRILINLREG